MKRLGIDLGARRIGVAVHSEEGVPARPLETLVLSEPTQAVNAVVAVALREAAEEVVVGLPLNMDGSEGVRAQATRGFARNMASSVKLPVVFWDERLSTAAVTRTLIEADASRKRRGEVVDKVAAAYILQGALDRMKRIVPPPPPEPL